MPNHKVERGKTGSFAIGLLQRINPASPAVQVLVLAPIRELAFQSANVIEHIGTYMSINVYAAVGGNALRKDMDAMRKGTQVVVGTPGRVMDLIRRGVMSLKDLKVVILDEADEMLNQGFQEVVRDILQEVPRDTQVGLFSATLPQWSLELAEKFMQSPLRITIAQEEISLEGIRQYHIDVGKEEHKLATLIDLYDFLNVNQCVIFLNTRRRANYLVDELTASHFTVSCIHSDLSPEERREVMTKFREGRSRVLIATDIMARGIDVQGVSVVINFDLTVKFENYIHRIGRCGRFARKGLAINFVTSNEHHLLRDLQAYYSIEIPELPSNFNQGI